jgi:intein/homing endonuclease
MGNNVGSKNKHIPESILSSSKEIVSSFLSGLFEGDGGKGSSRIHYWTTSSLLAKQVQLLLLQYGIVSKSNVSKTTNPFNGLKAKDMTTISFWGYDNLNTFYNEIGFVSERKSLIPSISKRIAERFIPYAGAVLRERHLGTRSGILRMAKLFGLSERSHHLAEHHTSDSTFMAKLKVEDPFMFEKLKLLSNTGYFWDRVASNRKAGSERVYDITVPATESFIANGFVVHNCWVWNYTSAEDRDRKRLPIKQKKARDGELFDFDLEDNFACMQVLNTEESLNEAAREYTPRKSKDEDNQLDPLADTGVAYAVD